MKKKVVIMTMCLAGILLISGTRTKIMVQSSEVAENVSPEVPEEELSYYVANKGKLFSNKEQEKQYEIYRNTVTISKYEYQGAYLEAYKKELEKKLAIEDNKLELGYTTNIAVKELEMQLKGTELQLQNIQKQQIHCQETIQIYGGTYQPLQLPEDVASLNQNYIDNYLNDNVQIKYYKYQQKTYEEYLEENEEAENAEDIQIQKDLLELDKQKYAADLQVYVKEKILQYETDRNNIQQMDEEIALLQEKIRMNQELYQMGKITEMEITEMETEQKRLEYEKMSLVCDAECIRYILEHELEGL